MIGDAPRAGDEKPMAPSPVSESEESADPGNAGEPVGASEKDSVRRARPPRPPSMGIFLSYRREDSAGHAGRLYENLTKRFGVGSVFRDIDTLPAGSDFVEMIGAAVRSSEVALVIIGPRWLTAGNPEGGRRLDDPNDFVRKEVEAALSQARWIIPVLVGGARMPAESELPASLSALARRNAVELTDLRWSRDVHELIAMLARSRGPVRRVVDTYHRVRDVAYRLTRPRVLVPAAVLALVIYIIVLLTSSTGGTTPSATLTGLLPSGFASSCKVVAGHQYLYPSVGATASAECSLKNTGCPDTVDYALFASQSDLQQSFRTYVTNYNGGIEGSYSHGAVSGEYGIGAKQSGEFLIFTATQPLMLGVAETTHGIDLQTWFQSGSGDPGP